MAIDTRIEPRAAVTEDDAMLIATMRNICSAGFSRFNGTISADEQRRWWAATAGTRHAWLYYGVEGMPVGFGVLLRDPGGYWVTSCAVLPDFQGRNYGRRMLAHLVRSAPGPCRAQARKDNPAAVRLHVAEDWDVIDGPDPALVYFQTRPGVTL